MEPGGGYRYLSYETVLSHEKNIKNNYIAGGIITAFFAFGAFQKRLLHIMYAAKRRSALCYSV